MMALEGNDNVRSAGSTRARPPDRFGSPCNNGTTDFCAPISSPLYSRRACTKRPRLCHQVLRDTCIAHNLHCKRCTAQSATPEHSRRSSVRGCGRLLLRLLQVRADLQRVDPAGLRLGVRLLQVGAAAELRSRLVGLGLQGHQALEVSFAAWRLSVEQK